MQKNFGFRRANGTLLPQQLVDGAHVPASVLPSSTLPASGANYCAPSLAAAAAVSAAAGGAAAGGAAAGGAAGAAGFSVVLIDINGNRSLGPVVAVLRLVLQQLQPQVVVVKSRSLHQEVGRNRH